MHDLTQLDAVCGQHRGDIDWAALRRGERAHDEIPVDGGHANAVAVERNDRARFGPRGVLVHTCRGDDVSLVAQDPAHRAHRVRDARPDVECTHLARRHDRGLCGIEQPRGSVVASEGATLPSGLRVSIQLVGRDRGGHGRERRERRLVAAGVQREPRFGFLDRESLGRNDVATVDISGHQMPRDRVLAFAVQDGPGRDVEACVPRQWAVVEVDRRSHPGEHVVGEHTQVGDAEEHVRRVMIEASNEFRAVADAGDVLGGGEVAHDRARGRHERRHEAVSLGDLDALGDQCLVAYERAPQGLPSSPEHRPSVHRPLLRLALVPPARVHRQPGGIFQRNVTYGIPGLTASTSAARSAAYPSMSACARTQR